jgi:hypothetical protein
MPSPARIQGAVWSTVSMRPNRAAASAPSGRGRDDQPDQHRHDEGRRQAHERELHAQQGQAHQHGADADLGPRHEERQGGRRRGAARQEVRVGGQRPARTHRHREPDERATNGVSEAVATGQPEAQGPRPHGVQHPDQGVAEHQRGGRREEQGQERGASVELVDVGEGDGVAPRQERDHRHAGQRPPARGGAVVAVADVAEDVQQGPRGGALREPQGRRRRAVEHLPRRPPARRGDRCRGREEPRREDRAGGAPADAPGGEADRHGVEHDRPGEEPLPRVFGMFVGRGERRAVHGGVEQQRQHSERPRRTFTAGDPVRQHRRHRAGTQRKQRRPPGGGEAERQHVHEQDAAYHRLDEPVDERLHPRMPTRGPVQQRRRGDRQQGHQERRHGGRHLPRTGGLRNVRGDSDLARRRSSTAGRGNPAPPAPSAPTSAPRTRRPLPPRAGTARPNVHA